MERIKVGELAVSENRRFLVHKADGSPFFYLGDTAWELFHRLNREEADHYLQTRAAQGFTVIQAVALAEHEYAKPNPYRHLPLHDNDPTRPNEVYFEHVDTIVDRAAQLGLTVGMLPTWGDKWNTKWGGGPEIFTPENARVFGEFLGRRYAEQPILWILGGDRPVETETHTALLRAMAQGLRQGDGGRHLITFHPMGQQTSAQYFHTEEWLDFNMAQTGHSRDRDNYRSIAEDYARLPVKPCMDAEPGYEDHPAGFKVENGYLDDFDARRAAYWALFAGAHGHTYGCHDIWQFWEPNRAPITFARTSWLEAILFPGARQMQHARRLLESRPFLSRVPDQTLVVDALEGSDHIQATRGDGYLFVYSPQGRPFTVHLGRISGDVVQGYWYDPREGGATFIGEFPNRETCLFTPPSQGRGADWVLVLDDASRPFALPGVT